MTFNTNEQVAELRDKWEVLNLVINGWPSIPLPKGWMLYLC